MRHVATRSQEDSRQAQRPAPPVLTRRSLREALVAQGVRMTSQRALLVDILQQAPAHLDAAKLLQLAKARDPDVDRATVYRTIALLKNLGLIDELDLMHIEGEKHYYEAKTERDHCHLACLHCGAILEYTSSAFEALKREIARRNNFQVRVVRLEVGGMCKRCSQVDAARAKR